MVSPTSSTPAKGPGRSPTSEVKKQNAAAALSGLFAGDEAAAEPQASAFFNGPSRRKRHPRSKLNLTLSLQTGEAATAKREAGWDGAAGSDPKKARLDDPAAAAAELAAAPSLPDPAAAKPGAIEIDSEAVDKALEIQEEAEAAAREAAAAVAAAGDGDWSMQNLYNVSYFVLGRVSTSSSAILFAEPADTSQLLLGLWERKNKNKKGHAGPGRRPGRGRRR